MRQKLTSIRWQQQQAMAPHDGFFGGHFENELSYANAFCAIMHKNCKSLNNKNTSVVNVFLKAQGRFLNLAAKFPIIQTSDSRDPTKTIPQKSKKYSCLIERKVQNERQTFKNETCVDNQ